MSDNWVVQNLQNALGTWNDKLAEVWQLMTEYSVLRVPLIRDRIPSVAQSVPLTY